jgi:hypothetical protein
MTTVYKVVLEEYGVFLSVNAKGAYQTRYRPGVQVKKKNLFVFTKEEYAENACFTNLGEQVWECETESVPRHAPMFVPDYDYLGAGGYRGVLPEEVPLLLAKFWERPYGLRGGELNVIRPAAGAHLVDDVKLIRRVESAGKP